MDPQAVVTGALMAFQGVVSIIQELRAAGKLTDDQIAAAAKTQIGENDPAIRGILAVLNQPAA